MDDVARTASLLKRDVAGTVGVAQLSLIDNAAALVAMVGQADRAQKLVADVQQALHDTFVDTTWPTCPTHRNHPLEFRDAAWWCPTDHTRLASLGELSSIAI